MAAYERSPLVDQAPALLEATTRARGLRDADLVVHLWPDESRRPAVVRPLRAAAAVRIVNRTPYPTREVGTLLAVAFGRRQPSVVFVRLRARGSHAAGATSGNGRVVHIGLSREPYPHEEHYTGLRNAPINRLRSWRDELVLIASHEAEHVAGVDNELVAERRAARALTSYRRSVSTSTRRLRIGRWLRR